MARKTEMPTPSEALPGRDTELPLHNQHYVNGQPLKGPFEPPLQGALFGLGCFWGAERLFWQQAGVVTTAVGYAGGLTPNPTYEEVCTGLTGHNEVVLVVFNSEQTSYETLLKLFWESHNPTQGMRQGNDQGTQYRSGVYTFNAEQALQAETIGADYEAALKAKGLGPLTTEIMPAPEFYYAEDYHQQYLAKNPSGYCGIGGTGVCFMPEGG